MDEAIKRQVIRARVYLQDNLQGLCVDLEKKMGSGERRTGPLGTLVGILGRDWGKAEQMVMVAAVRLVAAQHRASKPMPRGVNLSPRQKQVLLSLGATDDGQAIISECDPVEGQTVASLVRRQLIEIEAESAPGRPFLVLLTPKGMAVRKRLQEKQ